MPPNKMKKNSTNEYDQTYPRKNKMLISKESLVATSDRNPMESPENVVEPQSADFERMSDHTDNLDDIQV